jgi:hypothetical protein
MKIFDRGGVLSIWCILQDAGGLPHCRVVEYSFGSISFLFVSFNIHRLFRLFRIRMMLSAVMILDRPIV